MWVYNIKSINWTFLLDLFFVCTKRHRCQVTCFIDDVSEMCVPPLCFSSCWSCRCVTPHVGASRHGLWGTSANHPKNLNCVHLRAPSGRDAALKSAHLISTFSINTWSLTLKGSFQFQPVMDGLETPGGGRGVELESGGSSGTVINGPLPETSAARLSFIRGNDGLSREVSGR